MCFNFVTLKKKSQNALKKQNTKEPQIAPKQTEAPIIDLMTPQEDEGWSNFSSFQGASTSQKPTNSLIGYNFF